MRRSSASGEIELGKKYRDRVSGFEGVAICRADYIYGCTRVTLEALVSGDLKQWSFDAPALEAIDEKPVVRELKVKTGGPRPMPSRTGH